MPRKTTTDVLDETPPAGMDDAPVPIAAVVEDIIPPAQPTRRYPKTEWSKPEEQIYAYATGRADPGTLAAVIAMRLPPDKLRSECDRVISIANLFPLIGSRALLRDLEQQVDEVTQRTAREIAEADRIFAELEAEHRRKVRGLTHERESIESKIRDMRQAQEAIDRKIPEEIRRQRFNVRQSFITKSGIADRLSQAKSALQFAKVFTRDGFIQPGCMLPDFLFQHGHTGFIGIDRPEHRPIERSTKLNDDGSRAAVEIDHNFEAVRPAWENRRAELRDSIPALEQELVDAQAAYDSELADIDRRVAKFSYIPEE